MASTSRMRNNRAVVAGMSPIFDKALDYVMEQIEKQNRLAINKIIYNKHKKNTSYERTGEFRDVAWGSTDDPNELGKNIDLDGGRTVASRFGFLHPEEMTEDEDTATHSSPEWAKIADVRPYLAEIIYYGKSGPLFGQGHWTQPRNGFDELLARIGGRKQIIEWFKTGLRKQGVTLIKDGDWSL